MKPKSRKDMIAVSCRHVVSLCRYHREPLLSLPSIRVSLGVND